MLKPNGIFIYSTGHPIYDVVLDNQFKDENSCKISCYDEWENHFKWRSEDEHEFFENLSLTLVKEWDILEK